MKSEKGFTLVETIIALLLLGIVAVAFLGGLSTASKAIFIADERATAESLARTQMEYVKNLPYDDDATSYEASVPQDYVDAGYEATIDVVRLLSDPDDPESAPLEGIQKITITVEHLGRPIITSGNCTLEGYKVNR